ncbi:hypothetical protein QTP86_016577 [Hemibagrus guttatus]|nr:hypothetical protein QTP86_016577 [Hemibagrus guttatus]
MCTGQNDITVSVFTVTSKSITVRWSGQSDANSYKLTATPKNSREQPVFTQFSGSTVMGSVNSLSPNTVYTVRVEAMDSSVNVLSSAETEETTAPEVPSIVQAYSNHSNSITVEFGEVSGATAYILRAENNDGFFSESVVYGSPSTIFNLSAYTDYTLTVMSRNSGGHSQPSYSVKARTVLVAPALHSMSPTQDSIVVSWDPVENAVQYTLNISTEESDTWLQVNTSQTNMTFNNLDPGVTYCIKATAWDLNSIPGDAITICQITRPPVPAGVQVSLTMERIMGLAVYWEAVRGASVYFALSSVGQNCTSMGDPFCIISNIGCSENHTLTVMAENQAGPSSPSQPQDLLTFPCPPDSVEVDEPSVGNCSVTWTSVPRVEYYMVYVNRDDGAEEQCNTTNTICWFHCDCGYTYMTTVFVHNMAGSSPPGPILNYTTVKAPCAPEILNLTQVSSSDVHVLWRAPNKQANYTVIAFGSAGNRTCSSTTTSCSITNLPCGATYEVSVYATTTVGSSLPSYSIPMETGPCCPETLSVDQVTQSMTSVKWSSSKGGWSYITSLSSPRGHAKCHTTDTHCLMGCITCGTSYNVSVEAISITGHKSLCNYHGFSSSTCCPSGVRLYRMVNSTLRVSWRGSDSVNGYLAELYGNSANYTCRPVLGVSSCDIDSVLCGDTYSVVVAPLTLQGSKVVFCPRKLYSVSCVGNSVGMGPLPEEKRKNS